MKTSIKIDTGKQRDAVFSRQNSGCADLRGPTPNLWFPFPNSGMDAMQINFGTALDGAWQLQP